MQYCRTYGSKKTQEEDSMEQVFFEKAQPVWMKGLEREKNITVGWVCGFSGKGKWVLHITASSIYRIFLNGQFVGHGPARAAHGYYRVDKLVIPHPLMTEQNILAVEVVNFHINSFYTLEQPAFVQAELRNEGNVIAFTAENGSFQAVRLRDRVEKVQRYSFQRPFLEAYRLKEGYDRWRCMLPEKPAGIGEVEEKALLERRVPLPDYLIRRQKEVWEKGKFVHGQKSNPIWQDRALFEIGESMHGYPLEELEVTVSMEMDGCTTIKQSVQQEGVKEISVKPLLNGEFYIADMGINTTGFLGIRLVCQEDSLVMLSFDEVLVDGDVVYNRLCCINTIRLELKKGSYLIETIQPYTCRYLKPMVFAGNVQVEEMYIREYQNSEAGKADFNCSDKVLNRIFEAGRETFSQNAVDVYMDCPSRERAGWLCDSFFTGRVEMDLTGNHVVEDNFLENYALPDSFADIPEGMVPMCYPSDHRDGVFIANWALWLLLELYEYKIRNPYGELIGQLEKRVEGILQYMGGLENERELLEDVPGWIFVEWSRANDLVDGVNFPSNMLYSAALLAAGHVFSREEWKEKGLRIRRNVQELSYNGTWFCDHAVRKEGRLILKEDVTEVCQYYAFFFRVATPQGYPELFARLMEEFGPERRKQGKYPEVWPANAFIGNYLRMELLSRDKRAEQLLSESMEYFDYMAVRTGTLWENTEASASCDHGFASHIIHCFYRDILGVKEIKDKTITLYFHDLSLQSCKGRIPVGQDFLMVDWSREGQCMKIHVEVPAGYKVAISGDNTIRLETRISKGL